MKNPYAPPSAKVADAEVAISHVNYAGFWLRAFAALIDVALLLLIIVPLLLWIYGVEPFLAEDSPLIMGTADFLLSYVFPFVATIAFWKYRQGTPGKMMLGLKIVDADTFGPLNAGQLVGRYFAYLVSALGLCLGYFWVGWHPRKQGWHDMLAGSVVIRA